MLRETQSANATPPDVETPSALSIALAPGDGIGPEVMDAVLGIFRTVEVPLTFLPVEMGKHVYEQGFASGLTPEAKETVERTGLLFKGPMETPKGGGVKSINVTARKVWNTYANWRVFKTLGGVETAFSKAGIPIDLTVIRENIEDTYGAIEHMMTPDVAVCRRFSTRPGSEQVIRYAFEVARRKGAKRITCAHKANIMKITDGLFLETFYQVASAYPDLNADDKIIDDMSMQLVVRPDTYDVVVVPNLQGDILSDLCAGLVGGLGFAPSANIGRNISIFEAVHGTAPDIAGKGIANPTSLLLSGLMLLRHVGLVQAAARIEAALHATLANGIHTRDFGPKGSDAVGTNAFAQHIIQNLPLADAFANLPNALTFVPPARPVQQLMLGSGTTPKRDMKGVDLFIETHDTALRVAENVQAKVDTDNLKLVMISNRGTQVWPTGSVFTECVDQARLRFECPESHTTTQAEVLELMARMAREYHICGSETLMWHDGKPAYSRAQGQ